LFLGDTSGSLDRNDYADPNTNRNPALDSIAPTSEGGIFERFWSMVTGQVPLNKESVQYWIAV